MTINSILEAIIAASPEGKKPILTAPIDVTHMPALDGKTMLPVSSQLAAFYYFAGSWRFQDFDLQWLDPEQMAKILREIPVDEMITQDIDHGMIESIRIQRDKSALFAIDYLSAPFQRAYLVFDGSAEPKVVDCGSEINVYDDLATYLRSNLNMVSA